MARFQTAAIVQDVPAFVPQAVAVAEPTANAGFLSQPKSNMAHHGNDLAVSHPGVPQNSTPSPADLVADVRQDVTQCPTTAANLGRVNGGGESRYSY